MRLLLLLGAVMCVTTQKQPMKALSDRVLFQYRKDPQANIDSFTTLPPRDLEENWSEDDGTTLHQKIQHLENFTAVTFLDIKLVGFDGDGARELKIPVSDFLRFFQDLKAETAASVLNRDKGESHTLPIRIKTLYQVVKVKHELTREIQRALHESVVTHSKKQVPVSVIDKIVERDFTETSLSTTVYILNPKIPVDHKGREVPYTYKRESDPCPTSLWVGKAERYLWIDISASTPGYGPSTMGEGVVTEYTVPRLVHYLKQGKVLTHELVSHLVAVVKRTCHHLINPSLHRFPVSLIRKTTVQLLRVQSTASQTTGKFDWKGIHEQLSHLDAMHQDIKFREETTTLSECAACAFALDSARRTMTNTPEGSTRTVAVEYLDSRALREALSKVETMLPGHQRPQFPGERIMYVYLFDLASEQTLLLDQRDQATGFRDMVIAVQTQAGKLHLDMSCDRQALSLLSNDATRSTLAALLTATWAVSPSHIAWDEATHKPVYDFLWSTGLSVFGPFSAARELSFALKDAAARAVLYTTVNEILDETHSFTSNLAKYDKEIDQLITMQEHKVFLQRWNVFTFKLEKASLYLSLHKFQESFYYLRSLRHDMNALRGIMHHAGKSLHSRMSCNQIFENVNTKAPKIALILVVVVCILLFICCMHAGNKYKQQLFRERVIRPQMHKPSR